MLIKKIRQSFRIYNKITGAKVIKKWQKRQKGTLNSSTSIPRTY